MTALNIRRSIRKRLAFGTLDSAHRAFVRSWHRGVSCPVAGLGLIRVAPDAPKNIARIRDYQPKCGTIAPESQCSKGRSIPVAATA